MDMSRFNILFDKINEGLDYVPEEHKEEMIDCIIGEAYDTLNYYVNPRQICIELLEENKDNDTIINKVCKYLWENNWFCRQPKCLKNSDFFPTFFRNYDMNNEDDFEHLLCQISGALANAYQNNVNLRQRLWIWTDANDETGIMQDKQFQDYLIEILDEEGEIHGDTVNKTYIDIINIIRAN